MSYNAELTSSKILVGPQTKPSRSLTDSQRQRLQQQRDGIQAEWNLRSDKLKRLGEAQAIEVDEAVKFKLERQIQSEATELSNLETKLSEIEQNLNLSTETLSFSDLKKKELISDSSLVDELEQILSQEDELLEKCVKRVYQDFLLQLESEDGLEDEPDNLEDILWQLKDCTEQAVILEFLPRLIAYLSINDNYRKKYKAIIESLQKCVRVKLSDSKIKESDFRGAINQFKKEYKRGKVYLIIKIEESKSYPNSFQIFGWLATDEIIENPELDLIPLDERYLGVELDNMQTQEQHYTKEQLKEIFRIFLLQEVPKKMQEIERLIVEFFLPNSLLNWDVEKWEIDPENHIYLGSLHEVRTRSLERLSLKYNLYQKQWKNKWKQVQISDRPLPQFLPINCNSTADELVRQLQRQLHNEKIVGLKLRAALKSGHESIAQALYYTGTPIALWLRCEPSEGDCETKLNQLLQDHLLKLPQQVFTSRCQPECQLSLIWDNPNRLIPTYQLR